LNLENQEGGAEMVNGNSIALDEAMRRFPFLQGMRIDRSYIPLEIILSELDEEFLEQSLLEDASRAAGHFNVEKTLWIVRGDNLQEVLVWRTTRRIWPPAYLHSGSKETDEYHKDEYGESETVWKALSRQDLAEAQYIVLYTRGSDGYDRSANKIAIAPAKK